MMSVDRVSTQARRPAYLGRTMAAAGAASFLLYVLTLSPGVYPGASAEWVSAALGFRPWETAAHPLWRLFAAGWQRLPVGGDVWRLNLSSAFCGAVSAVLLCRVVACWVYGRLRIRTEDRSEPEGDRAQEGGAQEGPTEEERLERRTASLVAAASGAAAAALFATGLAGWSAATRFRPEAFELALVLAAFLLYVDYTRVRGTWRLYALALLCGAGLAESALFWVASPVLAVILLVFLYQHYRLRPGLCAGLFAAGLLGLGLYVLSARAFACAGTGPAEAAADWHGALRAVLKAQVREVRFFLPRAGWPYVLVLLAVPWAAFQAGFWERLHRARDFRADALQAVCLAAVLLLQFNAPIPPWPLWRFTDRLPVLEAAVAAMLGGWACAYWVYGLLVRWEPSRLLAEKEQKSLEQQVRQKRWLALGVCSVLLALTAAAALHNGFCARGSRGAFADGCARELLGQLGGRAWLVTDGLLDPHLAALAAADGRKLRVLNLEADRDAAQIRRLRAWVAEDPQLAPYSGRLLQAAELGVAAFLREWLAADPKAEDALALYLLPSLWSAAGLVAHPAGFLFFGARSADALKPLPLLEGQRAFGLRMRRLLPAVEEVREPADLLRWSLRGHLSVVANDLGVLLMDLGRDEEAFVAFGESLSLEPQNISALCNRALLADKGVRPEQKDCVLAAFKKASAAFKNQPLAFDVVRRYGQLRTPAALAGVGAAWALRGQYDLAQSELRRAADLAKEGDGREALLAYLGGVNVNAGEPEEGEEVFRRLLDKDPRNVPALSGLLRLALGRGDVTGARAWLVKLRHAGERDSALAMAEARIALAGRDYAAARERLLHVTDQEPRNLDAWTLLATALIRLQRLDEVERQVLPKMEAAVNKQPNAQVYQVRGDLARARGPASYSEARDQYRRALRLSPGRRDLLEAVIDLDLRLRDQAGAGRDASDLLRADADSATAHFVLGTQAIFRGELEAAEAHLRASVARGATVEALNNLAELLLKKGALEEAEGFARQALAKAGGNKSVLDTLACVLLKRGSTAEAEKVIAQARALAPGDWALAFTEARVLMAAGRKEEARALLKDIQKHLDALPPHVREEVSRVAQEWRRR